MKTGTFYIRPTVTVFNIKPSRIMASSSIPVTENGEADAKRATFFFGNDDEEEQDYSW